jgi:hypothetical protein
MAASESLEVMALEQPIIGKIMGYLGHFKLRDSH